jgi:hypothetical protein
VIAAKDAMIAELREQRDKWQAQAERLALTPPHRPGLLGRLLRRRRALASDGQENLVRSWPVPLVLKRSISSFTRGLSAVKRRTSSPARRAPSVFGTYKPTRAQRVSVSARRVAHVAAAGRVLRTNGRDAESTKRDSAAVSGTGCRYPQQQYLPPRQSMKLPSSARARLTGRASSSMLGATSFRESL